MILKNCKKGTKICVVQQKRNRSKSILDGYFFGMSPNSADRIRISTDPVCEGWFTSDSAEDWEKADTHNTSPLQKENVDYQFQVNSLYAIDQELVRAEVTHKNQLALVTVEGEVETSQLVVVYPELLEKARVLKMARPTSVAVIFGKNIFVCKNHFAEWVSWAKKVKAAPWKKKQRNHATISVKTLSLT